jgi:membrane-bound serine protease (ClpP class)
MVRLKLERTSLGAFTWRLLLVVGLLASWQQQVVAADQAYLEQLRKRPHQKGVLMRFEGPIGSMLPQYLSRQLQRARKANADLIVVEIDSPGGELEASFACAELLKTVTWADLVVYVPEQAYSGAAITALGAKTIALAPSAKFGDAGPIFMDKNAMFRHAPEKIRSALAGRIRELADSTGRPGTLAHAMVDMDWVVYEVKNRVTNKRSWMSEEEIQRQDDPGQWEKVAKVDESRKKYFLTVTGERAVELTLGDFLCDSREQLRKELHLADDWIIAEPNWVDQTIIILNTRFVTGLLFVIGIIALFVEFSAPGIGIGGLTSGLCFTLFFWSRFLGGTAGWLEVMLFGLGILFLLMEIFVIPGFGVAGLGGVLLIFASVLMACQTHFVPSTPAEWAETGKWFVVMSISTGICVVGSLSIIYYMGDIPFLRRLALTPPAVDALSLGVARLTAEKGGVELDPRSAPSTSAEGIALGDEGKADSPLRPSGKMSVGDQLVDVVTDGEFVDAGEAVRVVEIQGSRIVVRSLRSLSGD